MSSHSIDKVWWAFLGAMGLVVAIMLVSQGSAHQAENINPSYVTSQISSTLN